MASIIWGINPKTGKAECYALYVPAGEEKEYLARAEADGWTKLKVTTRSAVSEESEEDGIR